MAAHATNSIAINVKGSNLGPTEIELEIDYFKNAQDASSYLSLFVPSNAQPLTGKRLADGTVTAVWASNYGLGGPPELKTIEDCLGS